MRNTQPYDHDDDARSEFSVNSAESEVLNDENILDFKLMDAEFYTDAFDQVPELIKAAPNQQQTSSQPFITLVTADFYNHATETT